MFTRYTNERTQTWVKTYRQFLFECGMEFARCRLESLLASLRKSEPNPQVNVSQTFPSPSHAQLSAARRAMDTKKVLRVQKQLTLMQQGRESGSAPQRDEKKEPLLQVLCADCRHNVAFGTQARVVGNSGKPSNVCRSCFNPLPKCSVCLQPLGCETSGMRDSFSPSNQITWCLSCKHGGHIAHLLEWFSTHEQCPVASCTCPCASLDD
ncbi:SEH-associated protein 4 [Diplonema papillatum]|nr:SEH-associated protein 4 [Diplonema papillatum]KAJ9449307.1 SEH-associated protein 4 [Diplonema papillatum]